MQRDRLLTLAQASGLALSGERLRLVTDFQLGRLVFGLLEHGKLGQQRIDLRGGAPQRRHYLDALNFLLGHGLLAPVRGFASESVYQLSGSIDLEVGEIVCAIDPFTYLSHLSAMALHGLTDRLPRTIFLSSPAPRLWQQFARETMKKDLGGRLQAYLDAGFPTLHRIAFEKVQGLPVHRSQSIHPGAFKKLEPHGIRVSTLGRTFLDMLREPDLCGGIAHVLDVYRSNAQRYLQLIAAEVEQHGEPIDKVRAGYVLEDFCGLESPQFQEWVKLAARGGSRKLVGKLPYSSTYSERWCLSLNNE